MFSLKDSVACAYLQAEVWRHALEADSPQLEADYPQLDDWCHGWVK